MQPIATSPRGRYEGMILTLLRSKRTLSRSAIADITGLSPTTVTKAVAPLIAKGYVAETASGSETRIGRPAIGLRLVPEAATVCGVQLGVGHVRAGLVDAMGKVYASRTFRFDPRSPARDVVTDITERVRDTLLPVAQSEVIGVGLGAPGAVDAARRTNLLSVNLGWHDVPMADICEGICRLPTVVDHNVRGMAWAEARFGHGAQSIAFVYVHAGVGLGLVLHGEPFLPGEHGISALGHIQVVTDGEPCVCGAYGCVETVAAQPALARHLPRFGITDTSDPLGALERAAREDPAAAAFRDRVLRHLATGLAATVNLFNPSMVIVGGILGAAPNSLLAGLSKATSERVFPLLRNAFRLERTSFGEEVGVVGAATAALEEFHYGSNSPSLNATASSPT